MSKSLFIKAWVNGKDVGDSTAFYLRHESDIKKGDLVELRMRKDDKIANSKHLLAGAKLEFQYGSIGTVQSSIHVAKLSNVNRDYSKSGILYTVKAVDKGIELKKSTSQRIWNDVTLSDIAATIANEYGLDARVEPTAKVYHSMPQGGRSEWDFLNYLVQREHGNYHLQILDYVLLLEKNKRATASRRTFIYGENIVSLRVQMKEVTQKPTALSSGTETKGIDAKTGVVPPNLSNIGGFTYSIKDGSGVQESVKRGLKEWATKDGAYSLDEVTRTQYKDGKLKVLDKKQFESSVKVVADYNNDGKRIGYHNVYTPSDKHEAETISNHANEKAKTKVLTATLVIELDPTLRAGDMVTLQTEEEADCGNWFIETVTHTVDGSGGLTEMSLNKNGTAKPVKTSVSKNEKVNNTEGGTSTRATTRVYFGNNGGEIGAGSADNGATLQNNVLNR